MDESMRDVHRLALVVEENLEIQKLLTTKTEHLLRQSCELIKRAHEPIAIKQQKEKPTLNKSTEQQ